ncbi:MAG TPA: GAF domain-containing protein, partial [Polyangiaceae bacterium]
TQAGLGIPAEAAPVEVVPPPIDVPAPPRRATGEYAETKPTFVKPTSNSVRPVRRHRGPLTADAANEELEGANDRETLLDLFFDFSRQFFDYAALFIAHGEIAEGRDAFGDGAPRERVVGIGVPLDLPSMFATARDKKEPVIVRPSTDGVDGVLLGDLRRPPTVEAFVVPLLVRGRPVAILYADVRSTLDLEAVEAVTDFAKSVGQGFEKLIVRKKLAGFTKGAPNSAIGKLDASFPLPEKKSPVVPGEKVARATTLGKALFEGKDALLQEHEPQHEAQPQEHKTDPQTPAARGSMPPVLTPKSEPPPPIIATKRDSSNRPPPPQVVALVRPTGPPIPREEPEADVIEEVEPEPSPEPDAEVSSETLDDDAAQALLAEIAAEPSPIAEDGQEVLVDLPPAVPESDQAVSVGPRKPPTARSETSLPSIMVDIAGELSALVERVLTGGDDGVAEGELLRQGASAMPAIIARFPGPLVRSRTELVEPLPRPSECGPLLRLIARQR